MADGVMCTYNSYGIITTACVKGYNISANCPSGYNCTSIVRAFLPAVTACNAGLVKPEYVSVTCDV
jgi:hypothetical protein